MIDSHSMFLLIAALVSVVGLIVLIAIVVVWALLVVWRCLSQVIRWKSTHFIITDRRWGFAKMTSGICI